MARSSGTFPRDGEEDQHKTVKVIRGFCHIAYTEQGTILSIMYTTPPSHDDVDSLLQTMDVWGVIVPEEDHSGPPLLCP